jgi:hypothetical protein
MKGILKNTPAGWFVWYQVMRDEITSGYDSIPLDPYDQHQIEKDAQVFDNIEARIAAYPDVEFEIVDYSQKCRECGETVERGRSCTKGCFMKPGNFIPTGKLEYAKLKNH